jgi:hypothetical protein
VAKRLGRNCKLLVESAVPGTFNALSGNVNLSVSRSGNTVDTSTKDDFPYGSQASGLQNVSITATFRPDLPDANGYDRMVTLITGGSPFNIQIKDGATVVFQCSVYSTGRNNDLNQADAGEVSLTLVAAAAPTIDDL